MRYRMRAGSTGRLVHLFLEKADGAGPATGLRPNTPGARATVVRDGHAARSLTIGPSRLGQHADGGLTEVDAQRMPGLYEFGVPDDVAAAGAEAATIVLFIPGAHPCRIDLDLVSFDPYDGEGLALGGFGKSTRNDHLTSVFTRVMKPSVGALLSPADDP